MSVEAASYASHASGAGADGSALSTVALESLEHNYVEVMRLLAAEPQLEPFKHEYEKIHRLLSKSHEGERRLLNKTQELQAELATHRSKIDTAMQLSQEDERNIASLRKEIEKAWAMADTAHARETESREMVLVLKRQVADLDALIERSANLSAGQEAYLRELLATRKEREEENEVLRGNVARLTTDHRERKRVLEKVQAESGVARNELNAQLTAYQTLLHELEKEQKERASREASVREYRSTMEQCIREMERRTSSLESLTQEEQRCTREAVTLQDSVQLLLRQYEDKQRRFKAEAERLAAAEQQNTNLKDELPKRGQLLREKEKELVKARRQCGKVEQLARGQQQQLATLVAERDRRIEQSNAHSRTIDALLSELAEAEKALRSVEADLKRAMQDKTHELTAKAQKEDARGAAEGRRVFEEGKRRRLEQELEPLLGENEKLRRQTFELEQSHSKEMSSVQAAVLEYHKTLDHIRSRRAEARQLRDRFALHERKQKAQQELLDRVTADRNRAEKQLRETDVEWSQLCTRHSAKLGEIEQIKADVVEREGALCQLHTLNQQIHRDTAHTEQRAAHLQDDCTQAQLRLDKLEKEKTELLQIIARCDAEKVKHQMRLHAIINERNVLATQLIRRNEELQLLYSKIQLQRSALDKGGMEYAARLQDIRELRDRLTEQRLRCRLALVRLRYVDGLKKKELQAHKVLLQERARVRALTEDLESLVNVHRWRRLEGTAPALLDGIAKVQILQRKLLRTRDECAAKERQIAAKETVYETLRQKLARLPGPEAAEQLALFHENIAKREEQIAGMSSELCDVEQHAELLAEQVRQLGTELTEVKSQYFAAKTRHDTLQRERRALARTWSGAPAIATLALGRHGDIPHSRDNRTAAAYFAHPPSSASAARPLTGQAGDERASEDGVAESRSESAPALVRLSQSRQAALGRLQNSGQRGGALRLHTQPQQRFTANEEQLLQLLSTGVRAPNFPLQKPPHQRQFVGGGFALTR